MRGGTPMGAGGSMRGERGLNELRKALCIMIEFESLLDWLQGEMLAISLTARAAPSMGIRSHWQLPPVGI